jgi:hypothetical protein
MLKVVEPGIGIGGTDLIKKFEAHKDIIKELKLD